MVQCFHCTHQYSKSTTVRLVEEGGLLVLHHSTGESPQRNLECKARVRTAYWRTFQYQQLSPYVEQHPGTEGLQTHHPCYLTMTPHCPKPHATLCVGSMLTGILLQTKCMGTEGLCLTADRSVYQPIQHVITTSCRSNMPQNLHDCPGTQDIPLWSTWMTIILERQHR